MQSSKMSEGDKKSMSGQSLAPPSVTPSAAGEPSVGTDGKESKLLSWMRSPTTKRKGLKLKHNELEAVKQSASMDHLNQATAPEEPECDLNKSLNSAMGNGAKQSSLENVFAARQKEKEKEKEKDKKEGGETFRGLIKSIMGKEKKKRDDANATSQNHAEE
eukprot:Opistho-2@61116